MAKSSVEQAASRKGMSWVPGGTFSMGSDDFCPEERPTRRVAVDGFWMDEHPVTNAQFRHFVKDTGHVTVAERPLDPADYPDADPALLVPGSLVFRRTRGPVDLRNAGNWWAYVPGAGWRHPGGRGATWAEGSVIPSYKSLTKTPRRTLAGLARICPRRPSGSSPRAGARRARPTPGGMSSPRRAG